ncbi:hypothetical protein WG66_006200 [Moniliophthora roreri]|nr:hypothetical protein WG66_006200 [Moniliophthora roreri]
MASLTYPISTQSIQSIQTAISAPCNATTTLVISTPTKRHTSFSSSSPRVPLANITNRTITQSNKNTLPAGLQDTYDHGDPFNTFSESFYSPQVIYDFCCADDLENFSVYRNQDTPWSIISASFRSTSGTNVYNLSASSVEGCEDGAKPEVELTCRTGRKANRRRRAVGQQPAELSEASLGIIVTPPTPTLSQGSRKRDQVSAFESVQALHGPPIIPFTIDQAIRSIRDKDHRRTSGGNIFGIGNAVTDF